MGGKDTKPTKQFVARVDFEFDGRGVARSVWYNGWKEGDVPANVDYLPDTMPMDLVRQWDNEGGWSIRMWDAKKGRALRGDSTRIDFRQMPDGGWEVRRWPYGWTAGMPPSKSKMEPVEFDIEGNLRWLIEHGWTVHRFQGGMRAWKGNPLPVNDAGTIMRLRRQLERRADEQFFGGKPVTTQTHLDLAFDGF